MATFSRLIPLEITLLVIDEISSEEDYRTLRSISQTCKILLPYCRRILLNRIELNEGMARSSSSVSALHDLLFRDGNEEEASYVKSLCYHIPASTGVPDRKVISIIRRLSHVQQLELEVSSTEDNDGMNWDVIPNILQDALRVLLSLDSLKKLVFKSINVVPVDNFPVVELWRARNLSDLEVHTPVDFIQYFGSNVVGLHGPPCLHRLAVIEPGRDWTGIKSLLGPSGVRDGAGASLPAVNFSHFKELSFSISKQSEWDTAREVIEIGRNTLQHITHEVQAAATLERLGECITSTDNGIPSLKSLKFVIYVGGYARYVEDDEIEEPFLAGLFEELSILGNANHKHALERIDICIHILDCSDFSFDPNDWEELVEILLRPGFQMLRDLTLEIEIDPNEDHNGQSTDDLGMRLSDLEGEVFGDLVEKEGLSFHFGVSW